MPPLVRLRRAKGQDLPQMLEVETSALVDDEVTVRCLPDYFTPAGGQVRMHGYREVLHEITVAELTDDQGRSTGKILGWARWVRRLAPTAPSRSSMHRQRPLRRVVLYPDGFPANGDRLFAAGYFQANLDNKAEIVGQQRHWFLSTLFVRREEQGRGVGSMLISVGTEAADKEGWPAYLNSSPVGKSLYERHGFQTVRTSWFTEETTTYHMLRRAVPGRCEDGHRKHRKHGKHGGK
ncbi:unnamed protein product [Clonostachys byssicola]|uniref:N-acetyltransferase domain-containing protein n=1 Tax=Clonostachys byssicola TaxID=160290 RepID=A0A9N9UEN1_9HYPO|nr:unnamed protein product [Clonostachys byssicola]